jgi:KDO2-lipid IV(A) lauroyltransferase
VAERVKPESVYGRFVAFREGLGVEVLPASGGTSSAFGVLAQRLRAGKLVCLVCDRDVTGTGMEVEFFGEKARMMGGPAALAVQTGAALMPVILWFEGDHWGVQVHEEIPVPAEGDGKQKTAAMMQWSAPASLEAAMSANCLLVYQFAVPDNRFPHTFSAAYHRYMSGSGPRYTTAPSPL